MADPITPAVSDRICAHMNDDHADAILLYAKIYGKQPEATAAKMLSIEPQQMNLAATINGETVPISINFEPELTDSEDAHHTLIEMVKKARQTNS
ncbi:MAG: DUF2470 domain-containing protein [Jaaginema sp. PMC 1079.18]|nr:DUF2470 domain-containing protein [Jaaginema sp. PMC 1080.18]MEC4853884.1 DUF2470 domain-containing protein [Jaaginema sp. PMC 1079.18]MEC4864975.1 DUF2470 domain-containing protein [Jaaginema sp. PMC 1078.18]